MIKGGKNVLIRRVIQMSAAMREEAVDIRSSLLSSTWFIGLAWGKIAGDTEQTSRGSG